MKPRLQISPSLMCADFLHLEDELRLFELHAIDWLHIDVMDGHYAPNFTLGTDFCAKVAAACRIPLDIHLMIEAPDTHLDSFPMGQGCRITFHPETVRQPMRLIERIRNTGSQPGIALDPAMPLDSVRHLLPVVDQVTVMTVNPGYAGQALLPHCIDKIAELRQRLDAAGLQVDIEVDGNVSWDNIPRMAAAGATVFVAGTSSIFTSSMKRTDAIVRMREMLQKLSAQPSTATAGNP